MRLQHFAKLSFFLCNFRKESFCKNSCKNLDDYPSINVNKNCYRDPDLPLQTPELIQKYKYPFESHEVETPDGYILTLFRIPPKEDDFRRNKQPVCLQHGLMADSTTWFYLKNDSLGFLLANEGYDVWISNLRDSKYSRRHKTLKDRNKKYWDFSLDDMATNDIAAILKMINKITSKKIIYIGHSKGGTLGFMFASEFPQKSDQYLRSLVGIAPGVYMELTEKAKYLYKKITSNKRNPVPLLDPEKTSFFVMYYCTFQPHVCRQGIDDFGGKTVQQRPEHLLFSVSHLSAESRKVLKHLIQMTRSKRFEKFDEGKEKNLKKYGQEKPPLYNLEAIKIPTLFFYGKQDLIVTENNTRQAFNEVGSKEKFLYSIPINSTDKNYQFSHSDFTGSYLAKDLFYNDLINLLKTKLSID